MTLGDAGQWRALVVDRWPDEVYVTSCGSRMVCTGCGSVGADARPNWTETRFGLRNDAAIA